MSSQDIRSIIEKSSSKIEAIKTLHDARQISLSDARDLVSSEAIKMGHVWPEQIQVLRDHICKCNGGERGPFESLAILEWVESLLKGENNLPEIAFSFPLVTAVDALVKEKDALKKELETMRAEAVKRRIAQTFHVGDAEECNSDDQPKEINYVQIC